MHTLILIRMTSILEAVGSIYRASIAGDKVVGGVFCTCVVLRCVALCCVASMNHDHPSLFVSCVYCICVLNVFYLKLVGSDGEDGGRGLHTQSHLHRYLCRRIHLGKAWSLKTDICITCLSPAM